MGRAATQQRRLAAASGVPSAKAALPQQRRQRPACEAIRSRPGFMRLQVSDVRGAVESLYVDRLKPLGRILLKRIRERNAIVAAAYARAMGHAGAVADVDTTQLIDPRALRQVCQAAGCFTIQNEDGREYSVLLAGRPCHFVDVGASADDYPPEMWRGFAAYLDALPYEEAALPGGRYACAQVILRRRLPFFHGLQLGDICHIVHLALSQKRMLGYAERCIVPFKFSHDCVREHCAELQRPVLPAAAADSEHLLAAWEELPGKLWEMLCESQEGGPGVVTLSNVKRLFRARFGLELCETALGYSRLGELLEDPRLHPICRVETQGKVRVIVQVMPKQVPEALESPLASLLHRLLLLPQGEYRDALRALEDYPGAGAAGCGSRCSSTRSTSPGSACGSDCLGSSPRLASSPRWSPRSSIFAHSAQSHACVYSF